MKDDYKKQISGQIQKNFSDLEIRIMEDIVRRIKKTGEITSTADWQINRLRIFGYSSEDIEQMLKETLNKSYPEIFELYDKVIDWEYVRNKDIYEQVNAEFIPYEDNEELQQITEALIRQSSEELKNITKSLGFYLDYGTGKPVLTPLAEVYQKYLDAACMDIVTGAFDYNSVLRRVVTSLTNSGLRQIDYASGRANRVDVAARRAVMTGISQLTGKISDMNAEKLGTEYFEVAWHGGARPSHAVWQGKVWSKKELVTVCGLGTGPGLLGWNCYHEYYPFFPGISERNWTDKWLEEQNRKENTPKTFDGKEYTLYEAKQRQRQMETAMRAQREKVQLLKDGGADPDDIMLARAKYQGQLNEYSRFCKKMGLTEERERIYYDMRGRIAPKVPRMRLSDSTDKWAKEAKTELMKHEKSYSTRKNEITVVYDKNGRFLFQKAGSEKEVRFTRLEALRLKGSVVSHNHPSGGSFSISDIYFLKISEASEIRVVVDDGVYYMRQPQKWDKAISRKEDFMSEIEKMRKEARKRYQKLYEDGKIDKVDRFILSQEEFAMKFAKKYGLDYGKEFFNGK